MGKAKKRTASKPRGKVRPEKRAKLDPEPPAIPEPPVTPKNVSETNLKTDSPPPPPPPPLPVPPTAESKDEKTPSVPDSPKTAFKKRWKLPVVGGNLKFSRVNPLLVSKPAFQDWKICGYIQDGWTFDADEWFDSLGEEDKKTLEHRVEKDSHKSTYTAAHLRRKAVIARVFAQLLRKADIDSVEFTKIVEDEIPLTQPDPPPSSASKSAAKPCACGKYH